MKITKILFENRDEQFALFHSKLIPNISRNTIIGVRVPKIRKIVKEYKKDKESELFLNFLPHSYYDENIVHSLLINEINDYDECIKQVDKFLPYIDNWAVCDILSPKVFKNNKSLLIKKIIEWTSSKLTYTCRFGLEMLMVHYFDNDFKEEYLDIAVKIKVDDYYINMMIAWFFATALAKQYESSIGYLEQYKFDKWVHNKIIQKSCESYRITNEQKNYLKSLKIK